MTLRATRIAFILLVDICLLIPLYHYGKKLSDSNSEGTTGGKVLELSEIYRSDHDEPEEVFLQLDEEANISNDFEQSLEMRKNIFNFKSKVNTV